VLYVRIGKSLISFFVPSSRPTFSFIFLMTPLLTYVRSAVFNVLFVIGCCAIYTPVEFQPLPLTWWPLARDCSYYVLTLVTLVVFMADAEIMWWEALIQFSL